MRGARNPEARRERHRKQIRAPIYGQPIFGFWADEWLPAKSFICYLSTINLFAIDAATGKRSGPSTRVEGMRSSVARGTEVSPTVRMARGMNAFL
jgi:hypothetical protein